MFNLSRKTIESREQLLSIIIPSFNHEKYIGQAIQSVMEQTYQNWELIIVDDGSKDDSLSVIQSFKDSRIKVVQQANAGAHAAINKGLDIANGKYLAILNSDDVYDKHRFKIMIQDMEDDESLGFLCSYLQVIDSEGNKLGIKRGWENMEPWGVPNKHLSFAVSDDFTLNLIMSNFISTPSNFLFRRDIYTKIGGMRNLRFVHDWDFALRAAEITKCRIMKQPLLQYRVHEKNTISSNRKWMLFEIIWIWAVNLERFYGGKLFQNGMHNEDMISLAESLNLQGNDKVFWMIKIFIESKRKMGIERPEELLLNDANLRDIFLRYIVE